MGLYRTSREPQVVCRFGTDEFENAYSQVDAFLVRVANFHSVLVVINRPRVLSFRGLCRLLVLLVFSPFPF